ncbi:MAG: amidohydrolase family protein [Aureliella sp.]
MDALRIQTKFCIVSPEQVLHPAQLVIRHGRVVEVVEGRPHKPDVELGETVLMAGLVNPHTHLEFSDLQEPFPAGANFPAWISQVVRYRAEQQAQEVSRVPSDKQQCRPHDARYRSELTESSTEAVDQQSNLQRALMSGLQEAFLTGTTLLGDIVSSPWMPSDYPSASRFAEEAMRRFSCRVAISSSKITRDVWREHLQPLMIPRVLPFTELIGMTAERSAESLQWSRAAQGISPSELQIDSGLSPHAPYSLHFPTINAAIGQLPTSTRVAMHVAESREELQWCESQTGPFRHAFERLGLTTADSPPSIMQCVELLARFEHALLIHGNYLNRKQIERIATGRNIAVVYCPRTHRHFGHAPYPLEMFRAAGVRVLLGTDSRASNPTLSLWDEVAFAAKLHPQRTPAQWLESVTLGPARAMGVSADFGSLQVGRWASAVALPARKDWNVDNLLEALCSENEQELAMRPLSAMLFEFALLVLK